MKTTLILFAFAGGLFAQTTGQICWVPNSAVPAKAACQDVTPAQKAALNAFIQATTVQTGTNPDGTAIMTPKYLGIADLLMQHIKDSLFQAILSNPDYQPAGIKELQAAAATAQANLEAAKAAALTKVPLAEPK